MTEEPKKIVEKKITEKIALLFSAIAICISLRSLHVSKEMEANSTVQIRPQLRINISHLDLKGTNFVGKIEVKNVGQLPGVIEYPQS